MPHQLKLVTETERVPDSLKFERRREPRHKIYARVTAVAHQPDDTEKQDLQHAAGQICAFELVDQSNSGLGVWSVAPVKVGSRVTVFFPAHGTAPGYNLTGQVRRCVPQKGGYHIGLMVQSQQAAA